MAEFENLLSSQSLWLVTHQIVGILSLKARKMLSFLVRRIFFDRDKEKKYDAKGEDSSLKSDGNRKGSRCFPCNKIGHIKKNCLGS